MISHLEPDIMECKVKWASGSITMNKASGGDEIQVELFKILKDDSVKVLHSLCQQIWKTLQWPQNRKRSIFIPILKKGNITECSNYHPFALISPTSKLSSITQWCPTLCNLTRLQHTRLPSPSPILRAYTN